MTPPALILRAPERLMLRTVTDALRELARERGLELLDQAQTRTFGLEIRAEIDRKELDLREWTLRIAKFLP